MIATGRPSANFIRWLVWTAGVAAYVIAVTYRSSLSAVGVDAATRFHTDASTLSLFAVVQLFVYGAMQIPVGLLLDRLGARLIMVTGMVLMTLGQAAMAFSDQTPVAIGARVLLGVGDACVFPSVLRLIATWFPTQRAPLMTQLTSIVGQLGQLMAVFPLASLLHATSWSVAFGSLTGLGALFIVLTLVFIRNRPAGLDSDVSVDTATGAITVVRSAPDLREGFSAAWSHPGTRLAFWSHFTTPFSGSAFIILWGFPFLTNGEGLTKGMASTIFLVYVLCSMVVGPIIGAVSARHPYRRSLYLILPVVGLQIIAWFIVLAWPGQAPLWCLFALAVTLSFGGPASMVGFDYARTFHPRSRLSTASGIINVGGFLAALIAILFIGVLLDIQGARSPSQYSLDTFRVAFLVQIPIWVVGITGIIVERRRTLSHLGLDRHADRPLS